MSKAIFTDAEDKAILFMYRKAVPFEDMSDLMLKAGYPLRRTSEYRVRSDQLLKLDANKRREQIAKYDNGMSARETIAAETREIQVKAGQSLAEAIEEANERAPERELESAPVAPKPPKPRRDAWTDAEIAKLRELAQTGIPASKAPDLMDKAGFLRRSVPAYHQQARLVGIKFRGGKPGRPKGSGAPKVKVRRSLCKGREPFSLVEDAALRKLEHKPITWKQVALTMQLRGFPKRRATTYRQRTLSPEYKRRARLG